MCTLSYIPKQNGGFILTSNRDESILRKPALTPSVYAHNGIQTIYPKDTEAGGTWFATAENGFTLCLLNGAYLKHDHSPPYKHSRGLVIPHFFNWNTISTFYEQYDFDNIEPFTLVIIDAANQKIAEIRWDGTNKHLTNMLINEPHIWSSATLYEPSVIAARQYWFNTFISQNSDPDLNAMLAFHHFGGDDNPHHRFLMNKNNVLKTISISAIKICESQPIFYHEDLVSEIASSLKINFAGLE